MSAGKLFIKKLLAFLVTLSVCSVAFAAAALVILQGAVGSTVRSGKTDVYSPGKPDDISVTVAVCGDDGERIFACCADISFENRSVSVTDAPFFEAGAYDPQAKYIVFSLGYLTSFIDKCGGLFYNSIDTFENPDSTESRLINGVGAALLVSSAEDPREVGVHLTRSFLSHFLTERYFQKFEDCFTDIFQNCDTNVTYADWARISSSLCDMSQSAINFS